MFSGIIEDIGQVKYLSKDREVIGIETSFSNIKTEYPFFDKFNAVDEPDNPPPMIMMSNLFKLLKFLSLSQITSFQLKK